MAGAYSSIPESGAARCASTASRSVTIAAPPPAITLSSISREVGGTSIRLICPWANIAIEAPSASGADRSISTSDVAARIGASATPDRTGSPIISPGVASAEVHVDMSIGASREAMTTGVDARELRTVSNGICTSWDIWARRTAESGTQMSGSASRETVRVAMSAEDTGSTSKA